MKQGYSFVVPAKVKPVSFSEVNIEYCINAESEDEARKILASKEREKYLDTYEFYPENADTPEVISEDLENARLIYVGEPNTPIDDEE